MTVAEDLVAEAEIKLSDAQIKITEANTLLSLSIDKLTAENKATLVTLARDTQNLIKEAHKALRDAIKSLKDAVKLKIEVKANVSAETSATTE